MAIGFSDGGHAEDWATFYLTGTQKDGDREDTGELHDSFNPLRNEEVDAPKKPDPYGPVIIPGQVSPVFHPEQKETTPNRYVMNTDDFRRSANVIDDTGQSIFGLAGDVMKHGLSNMVDMFKSGRNIPDTTNDPLAKSLGYNSVPNSKGSDESNDTTRYPAVMADDPLAHLSQTIGGPPNEN